MQTLTFQKTPTHTQNVFLPLALQASLNLPQEYKAVAHQLRYPHTLCDPQKLIGRAEVLDPKHPAFEKLNEQIDAINSIVKNDSLLDDKKKQPLLKIKSLYKSYIYQFCALDSYQKKDADHFRKGNEYSRNAFKHLAKTFPECTNFEELYMNHTVFPIYAFGLEKLAQGWVSNSLLRGMEFAKGGQKENAVKEFERARALSNQFFTNNPDLASQISKRLSLGYAQVGETNQSVFYLLKASLFLTLKRNYTDSLPLALNAIDRCTEDMEIDQELYDAFLEVGKSYKYGIDTRTGYKFHQSLFFKLKTIKDPHKNSLYKALLKHTIAEMKWSLPPGVNLPTDADVPQ